MNKVDQSQGLPRQPTPQAAICHAPPAWHDQWGVVTRQVRADGTKSVTGGPKLKGTQVYSREFGKAVAHLHKQHLAVIKDFLKVPARSRMMSELPVVDESIMEQWPDANLQPVLRFIRRRQRCL